MAEGIRYGRKRKGIKLELKKKIDEWLASIDNDTVRKAAEKDVIVTGGAIASMLMGDKVNDYDLYFRTKATTKMVAEYYVEKFNARNELKIGQCVTAPCKPEVREETIKNIKGEEEERVVIYIKSAGVASEDQGTYNYFETMGENDAIEFAESAIKDMQEAEESGENYRPIFLSQNAITLSNKVQIVIRFYGEPDQIHSNYDFVHAMCYWDHHKEELVTPAEALEAMLSRTLIYKGSLYPVASIFRTKKFIERGWRISAGQLLKIMWQISEIDLSDYEVIREQCTGVDQAYLWQLIEALKDVESDKITSSYVGAIIDKIFD